MKKNSKPRHRNFKDKRSSHDRHDHLESPAIEALARFLREITPALKQYLIDTAEYQVRLADIEEKKADAAMRESGAVSDFIVNIKSEGLESISNSNKQKKIPKVMNKHHKKVIKIVKEKRSAGKTFDEIALYLKKENVPTFSGRGEWHAQTVHRFYVDKVIS